MAYTPISSKKTGVYTPISQLDTPIDILNDNFIAKTRSLSPDAQDLLTPEARARANNPLTPAYQRINEAKRTDKQYGTPQTRREDLVSLPNALGPAKPIDINRLVQAESSGNPKAIRVVNGVEYRGLTQMSKAAWDDVNKYIRRPAGLPTYSWEEYWDNGKINKEYGEAYLNKRVPVLLQANNKPVNEFLKLAFYGGWAKQLEEVGYDINKLPEAGKTYFKNVFGEEQYTKQQPAEKVVFGSNLPKKGFVDKWNEWKENPVESIPFISGASEVKKMYSLVSAAKRLSEDNATEEDIALLSEYIAESKVDKTFGYKVLDILLELPSFAGELYVTRGAATVGKKATTEAAEKLLKKLLKEGGEKLLEKKAVRLGISITGSVVGRSIQAPLAGATRIPASTLEKQVGSYLDKASGGEGEDLFTSATKAFGEQWVEVLSEYSGGAFTGLSKPVKNKLLKTALFNAFEKANPGAKTDDLVRILNRIGWNGTINEMLEERVADIGQGILYELGLGDQQFKFPSAEQLAVELTAFSVPGVAVAAIEKYDPTLAKIKSIQPGLTIKDVSKEYQPIREIGGEKVVVPTYKTVYGKNQINKGEFEGKRFTTDGFLLEFEDLNLDRTEERDIQSGAVESIFKNINEAQKLTPVEVGNISRTNVVALKVGENDLAIDVKYYNYLSKKYNNLELRGTDSISPIFIFDNGEIKGVLMGMNIKSAETIENRKPIAGAEQVKAPQEAPQEVKKIKPKKKKKRITLSEQNAQLKKELEKIRTSKDVLDRRRAFVGAVQKQFGLSDADLKKVSGRDIRLMSNVGFKRYLDDVRDRAEKLAERKQKLNEVVDKINTKELKNTENLRRAMKLPPITRMTAEQLDEFDRELDKAKVGDDFFSVRKLETVDNTDLKGIRTIRDAKERLAEELGVEVDKLDNIKVSPLDRYRYDTALAERNPFYGLMVDTVNESVLNAEARYLRAEQRINKLVKDARKSRGRNILERFIPQDKLIFRYLESSDEKKVELSKKMTPEEIKAAEYIRRQYAEMRDYLVQHETLKKYRQDYITHIRRGFLEEWKETGLLNAFKSIFQQYKQDEAVFNIIDDTGQILPLEKFFKFSMRRTGQLNPTENVAKAFLIYKKTFEKKAALDSVVPKLDIYAHSLTPQTKTPRGLEFDRSLKRFVNEWINTKKGRTAKIAGVEQGGKVDLLLRAAKSFTSVLDLGINIPVGLASRAGENITNFTVLGPKRYAKGLARARTKKGKRIIEKYKNFVGRTPFDEMKDASNNISDKLFKVMFGLFQDASVRANKTALLGSMTNEEYENETIDSKRLAEVKRTIGRYRVMEGSKSVVGATSPAGLATQYKTWAIPPLRTISNNLTKLAKTRNFKSREFYELLNGTIATLIPVLLLKAYVGDDDDDSFTGTLLRKTYRDIMTLLGALDPTTYTSVRVFDFLADLAIGVKQLITLEEYKSKEGYKGVAKLQRTLIPRFIRQFVPEETSGATSGGAGPNIGDVPKPPLPPKPVLPPKPTIR